MTTRLLLVLCAGFVGSAVSAQAPDKKAKQKEENAALLKEVYARLLAVAKPVEGFEWPPDCRIEDEDVINAYAQMTKDKDGKFRVPIIRMYTGMMNRVIQGDENRLALILGHELGHVLKKHILAKPERDKTNFLRTLFTRTEEDEADKAGVELMVKAGYSLEKGVMGITRMQDLGNEYSSFEGLGVDHPSWNDRLKKFDTEKSNLWKVSSAFTNAAYFLATEQYKYAIGCLEFVTKEYPNCYEAWANLGYAYLMKYCDGLDKKDLEGFDIGQIIVGGFYLRAGTLTRLKDAATWNKAMAALRKSNELKPNQTVVLANLGLAYLVHPDVKDAKAAAGYFAKASEAAKSDTTLDPVAHAALLVNIGVADLANAEPGKAFATIDATEKAVKSWAERPQHKRAMAACESALQYNRALALAASPDKADLEKAAFLYEKYLETTSPLTLWWEIAHDKYEKLCAKVGTPAKPAEKLKKARTIALRLTAGVKLNSGVEITLSEFRDTIEKKLGKPVELQVMTGQPFWRLRYEKEGIEVLVFDDVVLAIGLIAPEAPAVPIRGAGLGAETAGTVKVGMKFADVEKLLGEEYQLCEIAEAEMFYRFYRDVGLAFRVAKGVVSEVVVVQIPEAPRRR